MTAEIAPGQWSDELVFYVNGNKRILQNVDPRTTLLDYIRFKEGYTGTKLVCGQGGCGACSVVVSSFNWETKSFCHRAVNSCLMPLAAVADSSVFTTESLGSARAGFHAIQERIAKFGGSQCGYCTPGMVMSMFGLLQVKDGKPTAKEIEGAFDGNLCRCTGYRPIMRAFHSFAVDCQQSCKDVDIEDLAKNFKPYDHSKDPRPHNHTQTDEKPKSLHFHLNGSHWYRPLTLEQLQAIPGAHTNKKIKWVVGNTTSGVFGPDQTPNLVWVDLSAVSSLTSISEKENDGKKYLVVGGAVTLTNLINSLLSRAPQSPSFDGIARHIRRIAGTGVRNLASWAGNLVIAKTKGFPSDLATVLLAANASVTVQTTSRSEEISLDKFFSSTEGTDLLIQLSIPFGSKFQHFTSHRTAIRMLNSHPLVNCAFYTTLDDTETTVKDIRIVYGAIQKLPVRAVKTEAAIVGQKISKEVFNKALEILKGEVKVTTEGLMGNHTHTLQPQGKELFRENLVQNYFYKFFLELTNITNKNKDPFLEIADFPYSREISSGVRSYDTDKPGKAAIAKLEAPLQASGETQYTPDIPLPSNGLHMALVVSTQAGVVLEKLDFSEALKASGVVGTLTAADVKGDNSAIGFFPGEEVLMVAEGKNVPCVGQILGAVLAQSTNEAKFAASLVKVTYGPQYDGKPIFTIPEAIEKSSFLGASESKVEHGDVSASFNDPSLIIVEGDIKTGTQHPFYLERLSAVAFPMEDSFVIHSGVQSATFTLSKIAALLGVPMRNVTVKCLRMGGGFGGRLSRNVPVPVITAVAAQKFHRPVRLEVPIATDLAITHGRHDFQAHYKVAVTKDGIINAIEVNSYCNGGYSHDFTFALTGEYNESLEDVYYIKDWKVRTIGVKTNIPTRTATRSFGHVQAKYVIENIIEHVAFKLKVRPEEIREKNMITKRNAMLVHGQQLENFNLPDIYVQFKKNIDFETRRKAVDEFNKTHKWKKRGLSLMGAKYGLHWPYIEGVHAQVALHDDGSVTVSHGGAEIGTGMHTRVIQQVAATLECDISKVRVSELSTDVIPKTGWTGGSVATEGACEAARLAAQQLSDRLAPIKLELWKCDKEEPTWEKLVATASSKLMLMTATGTFVPTGREKIGKAPWQRFWSDYFVWGTTSAEVELDVLTGEMNIVRADILYDAGESANPLLDVGQLEGGFVFGIGYLTQEEQLIDPNDGSNSAVDTWKYKIPCVVDAPTEFNVSLVKGTKYPELVRGAKPTGEPGVVLSSVVSSALREAIFASRAQRGLEPFTTVDAPVTVDRRNVACGVDTSHLEFCMGVMISAGFSDGTNLTQ